MANYSLVYVPAIEGRATWVEGVYSVDSGNGTTLLDPGGRFSSKASIGFHPYGDTRTHLPKTMLVRWSDEAHSRKVFVEIPFEQMISAEDIAWTRRTDLKLNQMTIALHFRPDFSLEVRWHRGLFAGKPPGEIVHSRTFQGRDDPVPWRNAPR